MSAPEHTLEEWKRLMGTYPSDGWDGAAALIARHDAIVCDVERTLDEVLPDWREHTDGLRPRTAAP